MILQWLLVFLAIEITSSDWPIWGDSSVACKVAQNALTHHHPRGANYSLFGPNERPSLEETEQLKYPLFFVGLCILPSVMIQNGWISWIGPEAMTLLMTALPSAIMATISVVMTLILLSFGAALKKSLLLSIVGVFTTPLWHYGRVLYSEGLQTLLLSLLFLTWCRSLRLSRNKDFLVFGALLGLAINAKITFLLLVPLAIVQLFFMKKSIAFVGRSVLIGLVGALPGIVMWMLFNYLRFTDFIIFSYGHHRDIYLGFITPLTTALFGYFLSPGKGLLFYAPILAVGIFFAKYTKRLRLLYLAELVAFLGVCVVMITFHGKFSAWHGDWAWGPRYLVPLIPLMMIPLAIADFRTPFRKAVFAIATLVGFIVNLLGVLFHPYPYMRMVWQMLAPTFHSSDPARIRDDIFALHFIPDMSPILAHIWFLKVRIFGWEAQKDHYPWSNMGVEAWRPSLDQLPKRFSIWFESNITSWLLATLLLMALAAASYKLIKVLNEYSADQSTNLGSNASRKASPTILSE